MKERAMKKMLSLLVFLMGAVPSFVMGSADGRYVGLAPADEDNLVDLVYKKASLAPHEKTQLQELIARIGVNTLIKGASLLQYATTKNNIDALEILLRTEGINVNYVTKHGVLHLAIIKGHEAALRMLLYHADIDVNVQNFQGLTPFHMVVEKGSIELIRILLSIKGCQIDLSIRGGDTNDTVTELARRMALVDSSRQIVLEEIERFTRLLQSLNTPISGFRPEIDVTAECPACLVSMPLKKLDCGHLMCLDCLRQVVSMQHMEKRNFLHEIPCSQGCAEFFTRNDIGAIMDGLPALEEYLEVYKKLSIARHFPVMPMREALSADLLALISAGVATRHDKCGAVVMKGPGCSTVKCLCGEKFCYKCGLNVKPGHNCKEGQRVTVEAQ